jgi:hypothetical protein
MPRPKSKKSIIELSESSPVLTPSTRRSTGNLSNRSDSFSDLSSNASTPIRGRKSSRLSQIPQITQSDEEELRIGARKNYDQNNENNENDENTDENTDENNEMPKRRGRKPKKDIQILTNTPPPGWGLKWKRITSNSFLSLRKSKHSPIVQFIILCILNQNYKKVWSNLFKFHNDIDKIKKNLEQIEQDIFSKAKNKKNRFKRFTSHNTKPKRRVGRPTKEERMDLSSDDEYIEPSERKKRSIGLKIKQNNQNNSSKMEI